MTENIEMYDKNPQTFKTLRRKFDTLSTKSRIKIIIRFLIIFGCVTGLATQATQLIYQYIDGQTVVNIKIEQIKYNKIPSITICYPRSLSMERMAEKYDKLKPIYEEYKNIMKNVNNSDYRDKNLTEKLRDIYWENFTKPIESLEIPINELFDLSIPC